MTCQDCEIYLAQGERDDAIDEHLRECAECCALHEDLRANAMALESLQNEELPSLRVKIPRRTHVYPWVAVAAAAMFAFALLGPCIRSPRQSPPVAAPIVVEQPAQPTPPETAKAEPTRLRPRQKTEPLKIKMLTSDPDVVIYWLIED